MRLWPPARPIRPRSLPNRANWPDWFRDAASMGIKQKKKKSPRTGTQSGQSPRSARKTIAIPEALFYRKGPPKDAAPPTRYTVALPHRHGSDFVITPGGPRHHSLVQMLNPRQRTTKPSRLPAAGRPASRAIPPAGSPSAGGWATSASWSNTSTALITSFSSTWTVPTTPANTLGQIVYLFNGLQNYARNFIVQPVLRWWMSPQDGAYGWVVESMFVDSTGRATVTPPAAVNDGDTITGQISLQAASGGAFTYLCQFANLNGTQLTVPCKQALQIAVMTLESYGVTDPSQYPATTMTAMTGVQIQVGNANITPAWTVTPPPANSSVINCGQHTVIPPSQPSGSEVDIYYRT